MAKEDTSTSTESRDSGPDGDEFATGGSGLLDSKPTRLALIYGLPAVTCLLAGAAIFVSRMGVDQDIHILAQETWQSGGRAAVRVVAYGPTRRPENRLDVALTLSGDADREPVTLGEVSGEGVPALDMDVEVPDWPDGTYQLRAEVRTPSGTEAVATPIQLRSSLPPEANGGRDLHLPPPPPDRAGTDRTKVTLSGVNIELLPHGAGLVPDLNNHLFLRTTDSEGRPISKEVGLKLIGGALREALPATDRTDELGLSVLSLFPMSSNLAVEVSLPGVGAPAQLAADAGSGAEASDGGPLVGSDADPSESDAGAVASTAQILVPTTPAQMVLALHDPAPDASEPLDLTLRSLHSSRPVYLDAYDAQDGRWIAARTSVFQRSKARVRFRGLPGGLMLVQAYTATLQLGYGYSAHHIYLREPGQDDEAVLAAICEELQRRDLEVPYVRALQEQRLLGKARRFELTAAFLLSRLDRGYRPPPLRVSSERVHSRELGAFQQRFSRYIAFAIGILGLLVACLLAYAFAVSSYRAKQQRELLDADIGANEDDLYVTSMGRPVGLDRFRMVLQAALMIGVVAGGFFLIAVLVSVLYWR